MIRKAKQSDINLLAPIVRQSDIEEIQAAAGQSPREALEDGLDRSDLAWSLFSNNKIVCMGGVAPSNYNRRVGIAWFLASDGLIKSAMALHWYMPDILKEMHVHYPSLANFVDARNTTSVRWLEHLGFKLVGTVDSYGVMGLPFHWFVKGKKVCVPRLLPVE